LLTFGLVLDFRLGNEKKLAKGKIHRPRERRGKKGRRSIEKPPQIHQKGEFTVS